MYTCQTIETTQVMAMMKQSVPDPTADEMIRYEKVLKASHEAAFNEAWGLQKTKKDDSACTQEEKTSWLFGQRPSFPVAHF